MRSARAGPNIPVVGASVPGMRLRTQFVLCLLALPAWGQDGAARIQGEIERLRQSVPEQMQPASLKTATEGLFKAAEAARSKGDLYLSLEKLGQAADYLQGGRTSLEKAEAIKSGLPAFEREWGAVSKALEAVDRQLRDVKWSGAPAALRGIGGSRAGEGGPAAGRRPRFRGGHSAGRRTVLPGRGAGRNRVRALLQYPAPAERQARLPAALVPAGTGRAANQDQRRLPAAQIDRPAHAFHRPQLRHQAGRRKPTRRRNTRALCISIWKRCGTTPCSTRPRWRTRNRAR